jgi:recombination protein RecA
MTPTHSDPRQATLASTLAAIEKQFGKGAIMRLDADPEPVETHRTGSLGLDLALGCGGYPRGRIIEIYGPEASGKTTLALHAIAQVQAAGGTTAFIDAEHAIDPIYTRKLGVKLERLILSQPDDGEQALDIVEALARSSAVDLIVVDSVAALVPKDELEGAMSDVQVGLQARMMSKALRKLTSAVARTGVTLLFINQVRQKIGVSFGPSEVTTGGNALKYYASVRLDVRRVSSLKQADVVVGARTRVRVTKNKLAPPFRQVEFDIAFGRGIDRMAEVLDLAIEQGVVTQAGSWFSTGEQRLGHGRDAVLAAMNADSGLAERLASSIRSERLALSVGEA